METVEKGKHQQPGASRDTDATAEIGAQSPPRRLRDPALGKTPPFLSSGSDDISPSSQPGGGAVDHTRRQGPGENKSPSPPHSTSATLTTAGSSSGGAPSLVGTASEPSSNVYGSIGGSPKQQEGAGTPDRQQQRLIRLSASAEGVPEEQAQHPELHSPVQSGLYATDPVPQLYEGRSFSSPSRYPVAIKLLVSNNVAGSIIGRQGQTISDLQSRSMTRIKLSQSGDYFPGTHDRVCLVQGEPGNIKTALRLLLERMHLLHEQEVSQHQPPEHHQAAWQQPQPGNEGFVPMPQQQQPQPYHFVVRLLVPSSSCGMIIGKAGSNIKYLEESAGVVSVRLSPKDSTSSQDSVAHQLPHHAAASMSGISERVVTITGPTLESCLQCTSMVFEGMISHPDVSRYSNMTTSYSRKTGTPSDASVISLQTTSRISPPSAVSVPYPPYDQLTAHHHRHPPLIPYGSPGSPLRGPRRVVSSPNFGGTEAPMQQLESEPYPSEPSPTASDAVTTTAQHGFQPNVTAEPGDRGHHFGASLHSGVAGLDMPAALPHSASAPDLLAFQLDQAMQFPQVHEASKRAVLPNTSYLVPATPTCVGPNSFQAQVAVPDSMIGSILGRAGRTLNELQLMSGTRIWISQRGEYVPGTRNRVVTVRGPTAQSVWQAQMLISQRVVLPPTAAIAGGLVPEPS